MDLLKVIHYLYSHSHSYHILDNKTVSCICDTQPTKTEETYFNVMQD